jgi:hypothetical protein
LPNAAKVAIVIVKPGLFGVVSDNAAVKAVMIAAIRKNISRT